MGAAAKQRHGPAWVGVRAATYVESEPGAVVERLAARAALAGLVRAAFAVGSLALLAARRWAVVDQILRRRHRRATRPDARRGDIFGRPLGHPALRQFEVGGLILDRGPQRPQPPLRVALACLGRGRRVSPFGPPPSP